MHAEAPSLAAWKPAVQFAHGVAGSGEYEPLRHGRAALDPAAQNVPFVEQTAQATLPSLDLNFPTGHLGHW